MTIEVKVMVGIPGSGKSTWAQAEAEANAKIAASLTPELIEKIKYEQWNGQMPSTMAGTDSSILITP